MKLNVKTIDNKAAGDITVDDTVFAVAPRADLLARVVVNLDFQTIRDLTPLVLDFHWRLLLTVHVEFFEKSSHP